MNKEIFNKAYAKAQERIIENDIVYTHIGEGKACKVEYIQKIYDAALAHPYTTVKKILEDLNISMTQYNNMKATHMGIPEYRRQNLGQTRLLSQSEKNVLISNLKGKSRKVSKSIDSKSRKDTRGRKINDYNGAGSDIDNDDDNNANLRKMLNLN